MIDFLSLGVFAFALVLSAGSPGPSIAALVSRVLSSGWQDVMPFVAAMWIGEVIWLTLAMVGLSSLAETFHGAFVVLKYLGVGYLLWLAWKMWHLPVAHGQERLPKRGSPWSMFGAGMAVTLGNPKIMVFYLALLPTLIDLTDVTFSFWAIVALVTVLSLAIADIAWIVLASRARSFLRTPGAIRFANRISAGFMGGAAGLIATRQ